MEKQGDIILECFIVKGKGVDFLGVIYLRGEAGPTALTRQIFPGNRVFLNHYREEKQQGLSDRLMKIAEGLADQNGLYPVHMVYSGGIEDGRFITGLREAKKQKELKQKELKN